MTNRPFTILGIPGSLRRASMNRGLLRAAQEVSPEGVVVDIFELHDVPPYNEDVNIQGPPPVVLDLKARIQAADAILFATPEYNHSVPGILANALNWASRPHAASPLDHKPAAIMGAAAGVSGTIRVQLALRVMLSAIEMPTMFKPEFFVPNAKSKFDDDGNLVDEELRGRVKQVVMSLVRWAKLQSADQSLLDPSHIASASR